MRRVAKAPMLLPGLIWLGGTVHAACFRSISLRLESSTTLVRAAVSTKKRSAMPNLYPIGSILSFMQQSFSKNALHHARADTKLPADLEYPVATCLQF
jgi:hypothetical protein